MTLSDSVAKAATAVQLNNRKAIDRFIGSISRDDFLTTDGHGLTRMKTGAFPYPCPSVFHSWLTHFGCRFATLRCSAELHSAARWDTSMPASDPTPRRIQFGDTAAIRQIKNLRYFRWLAARHAHTPWVSCNPPHARDA